jgi:glycosyltransferase involved in cell wall biosynthesis
MTDHRTVYWIAPTVPVGSTFLERELDSLQSIGVDVVPIAPRLGAGALAAFLHSPIRALRAGYALQRLKARRDRERGRIGYVGLWLKGLTLASELRGRSGRVHACFADGVGTTAFVAAEVGGRTYSFTAHSPYSLWQSSRLLALQANAADVVICQNEAVEAELRRLAGPAVRTLVVRSALPAVAAAERRASTLLLCVGSLIPHKGFATAVAGVAAAVAQGVDVELEIIGEGPQRAELEELAERLGLRERVRLLGRQSNEFVLDRLAVALALLAPCEVQPDGDRDGLPVSIIDAAARGVPAIATAVAGIPELVHDGSTGLLVPERSPDAVGAAIRRLAENPELVAELGDAARRLAEQQHDPTAAAARLVEAWRGDYASRS